MDWCKTIAMGEVSTSAEEARSLGYLNAKDQIILQFDDRITQAKKRVLDLSENYVAPAVRQDVRVLGRSGLGTLELGINELRVGRYASEHDVKIAKKIAFVLCGGDLTQPQNVSENYLLEREREAFLSLCTEQKTLERIQHMLETGKPLRNYNIKTRNNGCIYHKKLSYCCRKSTPWRISFYPPGRSYTSRHRSDHEGGSGHRSIRSGRCIGRMC